ncbi:MAG TPA: hypothetical protein VH763_02590 [Gemmatimonadales bacterium]|jgi:hypothetical protein
MTLTPAFAILIILLLPLFSLGAGAAQAQSDADDEGRALTHYDLRGAPARRLKLAAELAEISGIAFTQDGRLLAHGDERGTIWQIDQVTGEIVKRFGFGSKGHLLHGDFEDIQVVGDRIFLVTSAGKIFEGPEGANGVVIDALPRSAGLGGGCEVEGLTFDPSSKSLLLLCKQVRSKRWRGDVVILAISIETWRFEPEPRILVPERALEQVTGNKRFGGSALVRDPRTGTYLLLAGPQRVYAEVSATGAVLGGGRLPAELHRQPEGLAIGPDLSLFISDEAAGKHATLSMYAHRP